MAGLKAAIDINANGLARLNERIDRLDTPLARRVGELDTLVRTLNNTVIVNVGKIDQLKREIEKTEIKVDKMMQTGR